MLGWRSKRTQESVNQEQKAINKGRYGYAKGLVTVLEQEHQDLLRIYTEIQSMMVGQAYSEISSQIVEFKGLFYHHLITENDTLYPYLKEQLKDSPNQMEEISDYRKQMHRITNTVVRFSRKWTEHNIVDSYNVRIFAQEYNEIGGVLIQRINQEEGLIHPLYQHKSWS